MGLGLSKSSPSPIPRQPTQAQRAVWSGTPAKNPRRTRYTTVRPKSGGKKSKTEEKDVKEKKNQKNKQ